jgi:predicted outer membrane repeat protein
MRIKMKDFALISLTVLCAIMLAGCDPPSEITVSCSYLDLIHAIDSANANSDTTIIHLDPNCTYTFNNPDNNDGGHGYNALPMITTDIRINGNAALLERSPSASLHFRFFFITAEGGLRLDEMSLYGGRINENPDEVDSGGGAIYNDGGGLTLIQVTLEANISETFGGAIFNRGTVNSDQDTLFLDNFAAAQGGAIFSAGDVGIPMTLNQTTFRENEAWQGGALYSESAEAQFSFYNVSFLNNEANLHGGAIYAEDGRFTINASTFRENTATVQNSATPSNGGAIYIRNGRFDISSTLFELNGSAQHGGAIYNYNGDITLHDEITFNSNSSNIQPPAGSSGNGGGIYNESGNVDISEAYFIQNSAMTIQGTGTGGAIYNDGTVTIVNSAFASNFAYHGGAILNHGQVTVTNASFSANSANQNGANILNAGDLSISFATLQAGSADRGGSIFQSGGNTQIKNSILDDYIHSDNCDIPGGSFQALGDNIDTAGDCPGISITIDPQLGTFGANGGFTPTFAITSNSVAFNVVSDCSDVAGAPVTQDQRGISRPQPAGSSCDAGAFEVESESGESHLGEDQPTATPTTMPTSEPIVPMLFAPQNTTCRKGDSTEYEDAGYLLAGESAEVIGRNQEGTWLVINNPDWEGICWILRAIVETEGDVDSTKVYIPAPLPIKTPILGCLVQTERGGDPVCVVPCPDDAVPGDPCTP